jgi:hypothetical protein
MDLIEGGARADPLQRMVATTCTEQRRLLSVMTVVYVEVIILMAGLVSADSKRMLIIVLPVAQVRLLRRIGVVVSVLDARSSGFLH